MLSRVAESIYWMSRYLERGQNMARLIDVQKRLVLDQPETNGSTQQHWNALLQAFSSLEEFQARHPTPRTDDALDFLAFDAENMSSVWACISRARENARSVREILSTEFWEQMNTLYHEIQRANTLPRDELETSNFFQHVKLMGLSFEGIVSGTMSQREERLWFRVGQLLERAEQTSRTLDLKYFVLLSTPSDVGTPLDQIQWSGLLRSASALQVYRLEYGSISPRNVAELLILGRHFPRSIRYCMIEAEGALREVLGTLPGYFQNPAEQRLGQFCSELNYQTIDTIQQFGFHQYIDRVQQEVAAVDTSINHVYFSL